MTPSEIRNSKEAQEAMLEAEDWPLIIEVMKPYVITACDVGTNSVHDWEDLKAEAWLGVVEAVSTYDPSRGAAFTTHASWQVRKAVSNWLAANSGTLPMPYTAWRKSRLADALREKGMSETEIETTLGVRYLDEVDRAKSAYIEIDAFGDDHGFGGSEPGIEDVPPDEVMLGFVYEVAKMKPALRLDAIWEFVEESGMDPALVSRIHSAALEVVANENRTRPRADDGRSVANRERGTEESRNRRG